ncbi:integral membrane protein [Aspergillus heteromorphus CBS 117.55]|uniref:Integral membrane protein n=1 Tax=Aspergillus heteromorphus CBS 117.55 TaxID=1448321 RepID=A0A317W2A1_9EURO|nr:uncharacterized protein BO70DRAFT_293218 [Aspergillus heteromorphus CBS 117.55]PWY79721.1 integral membrane protein [Aspergillus heteromorphus CBS 117.55]
MAFAELLGRDDTGMTGRPIDRSVQRWNVATQILCIAAMTIFFGLRLYTRISILGGYSKEDWTCLGAWILGVSYSAIALIMGHFGGGLHAYDVPESHRIPFEKTVYVTMVMYGPTAYLTKLSLLWIIARVFGPFRKAVTFIHIFLGVMLAYYIPAVIVKIRMCNPIAKFWAPDTPGSCLDQTSIILADAVVSVVSDMIILILPLPLTLRLQLPMKKKVRVMIILGAGGLACASSVVRLILILKTGQSSDSTLAFMRINMFGNAEIAIGVICACLPALSALVTRTYREYSSNRYSSNKGTPGSQYQLTNAKNSRPRCGDHSANQLTLMDTSSDHDILIPNDEEAPRFETTVRVDSVGAQNPVETLGIMKTVDVSTTVTMRGAGGPEGIDKKESL